jgi:hypothetical protein
MLFFPEKESLDAHSYVLYTEIAYKGSATGLDARKSTIEPVCSPWQQLQTVHDLAACPLPCPKGTPPSSSLRLLVPQSLLGTSTQPAAPQACNATNTAPLDEAKALIATEHTLAL